MVSPRFTLPPHLFARTFPFHLVFNRDMEIVQAGDVLQRLCLGLSVGRQLTRHFRIDRPHIEAEFDIVRKHTSAVFVLESLHSALRLKGQMVYVDDPETMLFLSSPLVNDVTTLGQLGLVLGDFAIHDPTGDFLFLLQAQSTALADAKKLTSKLITQRGELRKVNLEIGALYEIGREVTAQVGLEPTLHLIVERTRDLLQAEVCQLALRESGSDAFAIQAHSGPVSESLAQLRFRPGEGLGGRAVETGSPMMVGDYSVECLDSPFLDIMRQSHLRSAVAVPLKAHDAVIGVLYVASPAPHKFRDEERRLLSNLAAQAAIAIDNAKLYEQVRQHAEELEGKVRGRTRELAEANLELEAASRHKSVFLASMSHELRTPLNAILGYTALILEGDYGEVSAEIQDVLERVAKSGSHLLGLINDILDLAKIEAGRLILSLDEYSLAEVIQTVTIAMESLAAAKHLGLKVSIPTDLPSGRGDERRIVQVLLNLVGNAIKFTEDGEVRVQASLLDNAFLVSVSDTGPGILPADQETIFEEFRQADSSSTREKGGTGLGLSIAKRIVELHGGRMWVESSPGAGATFYFTLPLRVERAEASA